MSNILYAIGGALVIVIGFLLHNSSIRKQVSKLEDSNRKLSAENRSLKSEAAAGKINSEAEKTATSAIASELVNAIATQTANAVSGGKLTDASRQATTESDAIAFGREQMKIHAERTGGQE